MSTIVNEKEIHPEDKAEIKAEPFNFFKFLGEVRTEFFKITWPSKAQVTTEFISVLLLVTALTIIIFMIDKAFKIVSDFFTGRLF